MSLARLEYGDLITKKLELSRRASNTHCVGSARASSLEIKIWKILIAHTEDDHTVGGSVNPGVGLVEDKS